MEAAEIQRMKFSHVDKDDSLLLREDLARDARDLLDYRWLSLALQQEGSLLGTLRKLEMPPFDANSVKLYQRGKLKHGMWIGQKYAIFCLAMCVALIGAAVVCCREIYVLPGGSWPIPLLIVGTTLSIVFALVMLVAACKGFFDPNYRVGRVEQKWQQFDLNAYRGQVPDHVLATALQIRKALPGTSFVVETMMEGEVRLPDPFLIAQFETNHESYYVEVWDERDFQVRL